jgi:cyclophilin family peptidyl-prolyl cis-trans isomerase
MRKRSLILCLALFGGVSSLPAQTNGDPIARFHTDLGDIDVDLLQGTAPATVANFLNYVNPGAYDNSFIHRSVPAFIIQGGGYKFINNQVTPIATNPPVVNEFHVSNKRGTLAMAKLSGQPNSATDQWFFNLSDSNAANLDSQNGGFTVFGRIISGAGLTTMDTIAAVPVYNAGAPFDQLPLRNYVSGNIQDANLVHVIWVKQIPQISALTHPSANTIHVAGKGAANVAYQLQSSTTTPAAASFANLTMVTADSSGNISYDDNSAGTKKFYRFVIP